MNVRQKVADAHQMKPKTERQKQVAEAHQMKPESESTKAGG